MQEYQKIHVYIKNDLLSKAAQSGNAEILQLFLQRKDVDNLNVYVPYYGVPPLHLVLNTFPDRGNWGNPQNFDNWLHCNDFISTKLLEEKLLEKDLEANSATADINSNQCNIQACVNLLLQSGADILATDEYGCIAYLPERASNETRKWWYELVAKETLNIKIDLNTAGNGTAVVATLVATASFVGPMQPPLNYVVMASETATIDVGVQITQVLIKLFLVSNSLSFYLAITAIMLAIMPSLPISKEGLVFGPCDDLRRSRRTISIAIGMLLATIISVLISFAASSLVVIPLQHRGLMAYSTSIGGLICCIVIFFFFLRFLRLICPRNSFIKKLYHKIGIL
jgi:hypothetical protein